MPGFKRTMRNQEALEVRKTILALAVGKSSTSPTWGYPPSDVEAYARKFAKARGVHITTQQTPPGLVITRVSEPQRASAYPELEALAVGDSHLFELPREMHQRIRQVATLRNRTGAVRLSCSAEAAGIRVTRLPLTDDEKAACAPIQAPARPTKYDLGRLATEPRLTFAIPASEQHRLRLACSQKAKAMGWAIRCRLQDDGTMVVYRTDADAPTTAPE